MRNPYSIIFIVVALAFMLGAGVNGFFFPALILFFAYQYSSRKSKDGSDGPSPADRRWYDPQNRRTKTDFDRRREYQRPAAKPAQRPVPVKRPNPYKASGVKKYKDYDYEGAIEDFKKALEIDPRDIPTLFNIACAYSLTEDKEKAFYYLDKAVENGFKDLNKIQTHDAFAFIRIQDDFEQFSKNNYRLSENQKSNAGDENTPNPDLLEKLKTLADLRESGILTEEEFLMQKEKLLR